MSRTERRTGREVPMDKENCSDLEALAAELLPPTTLDLEGLGMTRDSGDCDPKVIGRIKHFLELKEKGVHFNDSLMQSHAFRNPSILDKLVKRFELDEDGSNMPLSKRSFLGRSVDAQGSEWTAEKLEQIRQDAEKERSRRQAFGQRSSIQFTKGSEGDSHPDVKRPHEQTSQTAGKKRTRNERR